MSSKAKAKNLKLSVTDIEQKSLGPMNLDPRKPKKNDKKYGLDRDPALSPKAVDDRWVNTNSPPELVVYSGAVRRLCHLTSFPCGAFGFAGFVSFKVAT